MANFFPLSRMCPVTFKGCNRPDCGGRCQQLPPEPPKTKPHHQDCVSVSEKDAFFQTKNELHPKGTQPDNRSGGESR